VGDTAARMSQNDGESKDKGKVPLDDKLVESSLSLFRPALG
jgi:hypothetical protein